MDETRMTTAIPPGGGEEMVEDERRLEQPGNDTDDGERTDQLEPLQGTSDADPEESREEIKPGDDSGSGVSADGDAEEPGEVPADEPAGEAGSAEEAPEQRQNAEAGESSPDNAPAAESEGAAAKAVQKIKGWKQANKHPYATLICNHLIKRCGEDAGFAQDVLADDKTFAGCYGFIKGKARRMAEGGCACVEDSTVYEWAEDYIRSEEKPKAAGSDNVHKSKKDADKSKEKRTKKTKSAQKADENAQSATENAQEVTENAAPATEPEEEKPVAKKPKAKLKTESKAREAKKEPKAEKPKKEKKDKGEIDGQIDLFDLFG